MLTTKMRAQIFLIFSVSLAVIFGGFGCTPSGARALRKGEQLVEQRKYSEAVKYFEEATQAFPDNAKAWNHLGLGYQYAGDAKKAAQAYQQALKLDQNLTAARYNLGALHLDQGNFLGAIADLTTFVQLEPKVALGWHKLGVAQMRLVSQLSGTEKNRQLEYSRKSLEYAQSLEPSAEISNALGLLHVQRGRARDAVPNFVAALQQQPDYAPALLNLAVAYHQYLGDKPKALTTYQQYLELAKGSPEAAKVQSIVRQLNAELNPPAPAVSAAPIVAPSTPAIVKVAPPSTVAPTRIEPKLEKPVAKAPTPSPKPAPPVASPAPKTQPQRTQPPPKEEPPFEVATLPDEPAPAKPAQDVPAVTNIIRPQPTSPVNVAATSALNPPHEIETSQKKSGVLTKLNPVTWFKKEPKDKKVTELPAVKPTLETPTVVEVETPSPVTKPKVIIPRYAYRNPSKPREGNREEADPLFTRGVQAQKDHRIADALEAYRQALEKDPLYFEATYNLALASRAAGDLSAALHAYEKALAIMPESINARYNFAFTLQEAGYFQDSANELNRLLRQNPNETRAHLLLASLYAQHLNEISSAREHYRKVLEDEPQHPQATQIRYWIAAHP